MKDKDIDQRHAAAYHVAGQAVMAFYLGGWVNDEGAEIDERRYCGLSFPFEHDAQAKERFLLLCDLAGWRAEHLWHGKGSSRDGHPDSAECYAILREPTVWGAIERVAANLMERGKLSAAEALEAIGGDAAKLHR